MKHKKQKQNSKHLELEVHNQIAERKAKMEQFRAE